MKDLLLKKYMLLCNLVRMQSVLYLLLLIIVRFLPGGNCELINAKVLRKINFDDQFVKTTADVSIRNLGMNNVSEFIFTIDPNVHDFYIIFKNNPFETLTWEKVKRANQTYQEFKVFLDKELSFNATYNLQIEIVYIGQIVALHKTITFSQDQFVLYRGNLLYHSPYKTLSLETTYDWKEVEDLELSHFPQHRLGNSLTYSDQNLEPFSSKEIKMTFKNNNPFLVVTNLERIIDVLHFGQICIEDRVSIKNQGSKLVGHYMDNLTNHVQLASGYWYTHLPAAVENVRYFDTIGNNSKSILLHFKNYKTFKFKPRYPLLSGWKTFYIIQYCVPTFEYLYHDLNKHFLLKIRGVDHILNNVVIRKALIKVMLPEAAQIIKADVPFGFERLENQQLYTGLSMFGRPTLVFNGSNILENHIAYLKVEYLFPLEYLLRAPLLIIVYLKFLFVFVILAIHVKG